MGNFYMEATQINYRRDETLKTVDQKLQELSETSAIDTDIAPVFKSNITYHPGDLVYYRNKLYVFTAEHTGAWAAGDVTATDVSTAMNTSLASKADYADIAGAFSAETAYTAGDLVIYNGIIYRCTNDHTGDWDADDFSATTIGAELNAINSNISTLESGLSTLATDNNNDIINVFGVETDGRYYTFTFTNPFIGNRQFFVIVYGRQDGDPGITPVMYKTNNVDTAELATSSTNITSALNDGVLTITVDCGGNAWTRPCMWVRKAIYKEWTQV